MSLLTKLNQLRLDYKKALDAGDTVMASEIKSKGLFLKSILEKKNKLVKSPIGEVETVVDSYELAKNIFSAEGNKKPTV